MRLTDHVRDLIGERDQHLRAATEIDAELKALHAMLAEDIPGRGPDRVLTHRQSVVDQAPHPIGAGETVSPPGKRKYQHRPSGTACDALILAAVDSGLCRGREIAKACDLPWETIRQELYSLVDRGVLLRTGQTQNTRYTRAKGTCVPKADPPAAVPSESRIQGIPSGAGSHLTGPPSGVAVSGATARQTREPEYEVAWRPHRDAPSLIGNRITKASTL